MTVRSPLVMTNIRLTPDELFEYRSMALDEGKSLSQWVRDSLRAYHAAQVGTVRKEEAESSDE
jgi:hypothetical protein